MNDVKISVTDTTIDDVADEIIMSNAEVIDKGDHFIYVIREKGEVKILVKGDGSAVTELMLSR